MPKKSLTGWSKRSLVGTNTRRPLSGMASAAAAANGHICADWLGQVPLFGFATQLPVDPLVRYISDKSPYYCDQYVTQRIDTDIGNNVIAIHECREA